MHENRDAALRRLKRLEGQVRGIARMVEEDRYCVDVLTQIAAVRAALKGVEKLVIDDHAAHCIEDALASGDRDDQRAKFMELVELLDKARGCAPAPPVGPGASVPVNSLAGSPGGPAPRRSRPARNSGRSAAPRGRAPSR